MQYRNLPSVESVMATRQLQGLAILYQRDWLVNLVRQHIDAARDGVRRGDDAATIDEIAVRAAHQASRHRYAAGLSRSSTPPASSSIPT